MGVVEHVGDGGWQPELHHVESVAEFTTLVAEKYAGKHGFIWRGHACQSWELVSSDLRNLLPYYRTLEGEKDASYSDVRFWTEMCGPSAFLHFFERIPTLPEYSSRFEDISRKNPENLSEDEQNEIWALGRHFGLATPLLDWTQSPYVALFFAHSEVGGSTCPEPDDENVAVWGLVPLSVSQFLDPDEHKMYFRSIWPKRALSSRFLAQQSVFTRLSPNGPYEELLAPLESGSGFKPHVARITMPRSKSLETLQHLHKMNISSLTLFPDIDGLCRFANMSAFDPDMTGTTWGGVPPGYAVPGGLHYGKRS